MMYTHLFLWMSGLSDNLFVSGSYSEQYGKGIRLSISLYLILYIWLVEI